MVLVLFMEIQFQELFPTGGRAEMKGVLNTDHAVSYVDARRSPKKTIAHPFAYELRAHMYALYSNYTCNIFELIYSKSIGIMSKTILQLHHPPSPSSPYLHAPALSFSTIAEEGYTSLARLGAKLGINTW